MLNRILVWDLPTRVFHWLLTAAVLGAAGIALLVDDDRPLFQTHMLLGLIAGFLVVLRAFWGVVGTRYARFGSFLFGPRDLLRYLRGAFQHTGERHIGHNPGSAFAIYTMLLLPIGLVLSGVLMSTSKALEEVHEVMSYLMLATVAVHIIGLAWHTIRQREDISLSMIDGKKVGEDSKAIASSRPVAGVMFLALAVGWAFLVFDGHDVRAGQVTVFGQTVRLGESEREDSDGKEHDGEHRRSYRGERHRREHDDRHEDDDD